MPALRIATLNIWNRMGVWEARQAAIREALRAVDADIVGLQEVLHLDNEEGIFDQAALVSEGLGYAIAYGRHPDAIHPMGNAILSRHKILASEVLPLPQCDTDERRTLLYAEIDAPCGRVPFFCTHLNWKLDEGHVREVQMRFVADAIAERAPADAKYPPILVGDLNAEPDADEIRFLRGLTSLGGKRVYFADCFGLVGRGDGTTFSRANPYAAPLREPNRRIDYIFVRGPDDGGRGEPLEAALFANSAWEGTFPSDHFGVTATLRG